MYLCFEDTKTAKKLRKMKKNPQEVVSKKTRQGQGEKKSSQNSLEHL